MYLETLKQNKICSIPDRKIVWKINKSRLELEMILDWKKAETGLPLPLNGIGVCKDWRIVVRDDNTALFTGYWLLSNVKVKNFDKLNNLLGDFIVFS